MYLARRIVRNQYHFFISESFRDGDCLRNRDLLDLGPTPQHYIHYSGGRVFYIDDQIAEDLQASGVDPDPFELERIFAPFVDPEIRYRLDAFGERSRHRNWKPATGQMRRKILESTHEFDRRRAHFLRFGQTDQRQLLRAVSLYRVLLDKSRDEIEQYFLFQEMTLRPQEYRNYIYAIFNLQAFFSQNFAHTMPEALDGEKMDMHFIDQICLLHSDGNFWQGFDRGDTLHSYLVRYVIMYFDYSFATGTGWEQYIRNFMDSRRRYTPPKSARRMSMQEAATVFGVGRGELAEMDLRELKRLFRKKAQELHPDRGGDHEAFIELSTAYQELSRTKMRNR